MFDKLYDDIICLWTPSSRMTWLQSPNVNTTETNTQRMSSESRSHQTSWDFSSSWMWFRSNPQLQEAGCQRTSQKDSHSLCLSVLLSPVKIRSDFMSPLPFSCHRVQDCVKWLQHFLWTCVTETWSFTVTCCSGSSKTGLIGAGSSIYAQVDVCPQFHSDLGYKTEPDGLRFFIPLGCFSNAVCRLQGRSDPDAETKTWTLQLKTFPQ